MRLDLRNFQNFLKSDKEFTKVLVVQISKNEL